jgi:heterodisulfide reductase subunit B
MDRLFGALGAEVVDFSLKTKCCGGMLMTTAEPVALKLVRNLLDLSAKSDADCVVTPCPLCQFNLDAYQDRVNSMFRSHFSIPVLYFTQIVGVALGLSEKEILLGKEIVPAKRVLSSYVGGQL